MTMKIEVTIPEDDIKAGAGAQYLSRAMSAIGFARGVSLPMPAAPEVAPEAKPEVAPEAKPEVAPEVAPQSETGENAPVRERGKPAAGRARRTKEGIAEDEAADKADAATAPSEEPKPAISTGEDRIDPTSAEDAAQDAADEAAEAEAAKTPELTHDDVRAALGKYLDAYGTPAAMEDGPKVLKLLFGPDAAKVSDIPATQEAFAKAIAGIEEMLAKNPYKREVRL